LLVLTDEIYEDITYDGLQHFSIGSLPGMKERTISVFGFSKSYAMTGWRVGYAISSKPIISQMRKIQEFYVTQACSISQRAALAALEGPQDCVRNMVNEFQKRRDFLHAQLARIDTLTCTKPRGAFYLFPNISGTGRKSQQVARLLLDKAKVVTVPGDAFGKNGENFVRLSYATSEKNLRLAVTAIRLALTESQSTKQQR